jgi:murein DD-endopeptidase MepM/ murein hydrolase activator NlpD
MKVLVRLGAVTALLVVQQLLAPLTGLAQVDPCEPVPIPGLCDPIPSPSPDPPPSPPGGGDTGGTGGGESGGGATGGGGGGGGQGSQGSDKGGGQAEGQKGKKGPGQEGPTAPPTPSGPFVVSSPNNSAHLVEILASLTRYDMPLRESLLEVVGPFPVAGLAYWTDDWHACRDGCTRFHEGLDIFAKTGTPLVATADGFVSQKLVGDLSGISVEITDAQGVQYFYAHLSAWAPGIQVGDQVRVGQVLGYMGNTGNAISTPPHLHLEVQPGGVPVPPKPFVDRWLKLAELRAEQLVTRVTGQVPETLTEASTFRLTRLFDLTGGGETLSTGAERLLALAGIQPSVSSLELARATLEQMAWEIYWGGQADAELARLIEQFSTLAGGQDLATATPWSPFGASQSTGSVEVAPGVTVPTTPEAGD